MKRTILSSLSSLSLSPASLFSPSLTLNLSTLPHFFFPSDAPRLLSIHFISLQFFGAISPLIPRLSLIRVSPGFLSPAEGGGGGAGTEQKKKKKKNIEGRSLVRRPLTTHTLTWWRWSRVVWLAFCGTNTYMSHGRWRPQTSDPMLRNARGGIPSVEVIPEGVACSSSTRNTCSKYSARKVAAHFLKADGALRTCRQLKLSVTLAARVRRRGDVLHTGLNFYPVQVNLMSSMSVRLKFLKM